MHAGDEQTLFASLKILKALQMQKFCGHNLAMQKYFGWQFQNINVPILVIFNSTS